MWCRHVDDILAAGPPGPTDQLSNGPTTRAPTASRRTAAARRASTRLDAEGCGWGPWCPAGLVADASEPLSTLGLRSTRQGTAVERLLLDSDGFRSAQQLQEVLLGRGDHVGLTRVKVDGPVVESSAQNVAAAHGFTAVEHTIEIAGTCTTCATLTGLNPAAAREGTQLVATPRSWSCRSADQPDGRGS